MTITTKRTKPKVKHHAEDTGYPPKTRQLPSRSVSEPNTLTASPVPSLVDEHGTIVISDVGDLVLMFEHEQDRQTHQASFRVNSSIVRDASPYFEVLLDPSRFEEGRRVATALASHQTGTTGSSSTPEESQDGAVTNDKSAPAVPPSPALPSISIQDIGNISTVKSITLLITDFLRLLHSQPLTTPHPPLINLANLSIVFDRFSALPILTKYAHTHHLFAHIDAKLKPRNLPEDKQRQRALVALHLSHAPWLGPSTQRLVQRSSLSSSSSNSSVGHPDDPAISHGPAWNDLPADLEDELLVRRHALLATLQSIQSALLSAYASRGAPRQCKLGYESSVACDAFQLGEAVKFFSRAGTLALAGTLTATAATAEREDGEGHGEEGGAAGEAKYGGAGGASGGDDGGGGGGTGHIVDLVHVIDRWRACPEYQIDANHHHCGVRTRMLPCLDAVERAIEESGVCGDCWRERRERYAWREAKGLLVWKRGREEQQQQGRGREQGGCLGRHLAVRDMCLAVERVWC